MAPSEEIVFLAPENTLSGSEDMAGIENMSKDIAARSVNLAICAGSFYQ